MVMNFEHMATRIPLNVRVDIWNIILYNIGFKNRAINNIMDEYEISDYEYFYEGVTYG
tara:strand:- start:1437 stop:1610 length:174 start_codon:yes stop_codon:yes gene_type:complete